LAINYSSNPSDPASTAGAGKSACFEDALAELEAIVHRLEEGQIGLAEALGQYEQGIKLLRQCYALLENTERRIEVLSRVTDDGEAITQTWDDSALSLEEKAQTRSRRRSNKPAPTPTPEPNGEPDDSDAGGRLF
jgi:exodeoxyribonuclease VII small subunit